MTYGYEYYMNLARHESATLRVHSYDEWLATMDWGTKHYFERYDYDVRIRLAKGPVYAMLIPNTLEEVIQFEKLLAKHPEKFPSTHVKAQIIKYPKYTGFLISGSSLATMMPMIIDELVSEKFGESFIMVSSLRKPSCQLLT